MPGRRSRLIIHAVTLVLVASTCRAPAPTSTSVPLPGTATATLAKPAGPTPGGSASAPTLEITLPAPTQTQPTPTVTPTPFPSWPERWEPTGGPEGGFIGTVAIDPQNPEILYAAGTGGAVYKSRDGAETWLPQERLANPACPFIQLIIAAHASATIYAANACTGLFKSSDAGSTWEQIGNGIISDVSVLIQSPHAPGLLLVASSDGQVYRSWDGAATWEAISNGLPGDPIRQMSASASDTYWATTANGHSSTLHRFTSGAWSAVSVDQPSGAEITSVLVDPQDPSIMYVGLENVQQPVVDPEAPYLFRSSDGGFSWRALQPLAQIGQPGDTRKESHAWVYLLGKAQPSGILYIATQRGILTSDDGGDTWQHLGWPQQASAARGLRQLAIDPGDNSVLYLPLQGVGIVRSDDGGRSWQPVNHGLNNMLVGTVKTHPQDGATVFAVQSGGEGVFTSTDYGATWTKLHHVDTAVDGPQPNLTSNLVLDPSQPGTIYQIVDGTRTYRSDDGGATWFEAWPEFRLSSIYSMAIAPSDPNIVYASMSGSGLFRSDDGGNTWRFLSGSGVDYSHALAVHPENPDFVLSGKSRKPFETLAGLHRSKDGGLTWDVPLQVPDALGITSVVIDPRVEPNFAPGRRPADPTRLYAGSTGPRGWLWFSDDAGDSWKPLNDDLSFTNVSRIAVAYHRTGVAYASAWGGGTWRTTDGGQTWQRLPGDPATSAVAVAVDPSNHNVIYIADGTTPHLYRSTDDGKSWELLFDAGEGYERLEALALAPSDPAILYVSAIRTTTGTMTGAVFQIDTNAPNGENAKDVTSNLPAPPVSLAVHRRDPRRIFAALHGAGVWKSLDDGASWRQVRSGLPDVGFIQIAVDPVMPETLYLTGGYDAHSETRESVARDPDEIYGIWKSTDDGNSWIKVGGATLGRLSGPITSLAFHPDDQRVMYAAGEGGVYLSPDRGETWTSINGRLPNFGMHSVATDGQSLFVGSAGAGVFVGAIHPLIHTADWTRESHLTVPIAHVQITLHPDDPLVLFASAYPGGVFKTTDGGVTWRARNLGLPSFPVADPARQGYFALTIAPSAPNVLFVGLYGQGLFRSDDAAATWRPASAGGGEPDRATLQAVLIDPEDPNTVYVGTEHGVWRSTDSGHSWNQSSEGLPPGGDIRTLALASDGQFYAGSRGYGLYTRQVTEDTWRQLPPILDGKALGPIGGLFQSTDDTPDGPGIHTSLSIHPSDPNTLYAATVPAGVFKTVDGGGTWRERNVGFGNNGALFLAFHPNDPQILYAGTTNGILRSTDGAESWRAWDIGWPPRQQVLSLAFDPADPDTMYACSRDAVDEEEFGATVMKSIDGGANWFESAVGLDATEACYTVLVDRFDSNLLYLATEQAGTYISRDAGATWTTWNEGLWSRASGGNGVGMTEVLQLSADGRLLYFGTAGAGVWRRPAVGGP